MARSIPDRLMPHRVQVAPYLGAGPSGRHWADWLPEQRALVEGMTAVRLSPLGDEVAATSRAFVDAMDLPVGSKLRHGASTYLVAAVRRFDHPQAASYLDVALSYLEG